MGGGKICRTDEDHLAFGKHGSLALGWDFCASETFLAEFVLPFISSRQPFYQYKTGVSALSFPPLFMSSPRVLDVTGDL